VGDLIPPDLLPEMRAIIPDEEARRRDKARQAARNRAAEGRYATNYTKTGVRECNEQKRATARLMRAAGKSYREIAAELGVSLDTAYRWGG
jgi:DNA invertase Pin-like site-specific DNA recombinase